MAPHPSAPPPAGAPPRRRALGAALVLAVAGLVAAVAALVAGADPERPSGGPIAAPPPAAPPPPPPPPAVQPPRVDRHLLRDGEGDRLLLKGATIYMVPFHAWPPGSGQADENLRRASDAYFRDRHGIFARMRQVGMNTVRLPVAIATYYDDLYDLGGEEAYLDRIQATVDAARQAGLYVVIGWWDTGGARFAEEYDSHFAMMADVHERLGSDPMVMYEPFNEPYDIAWPEWRAVMESTLEFWRAAIGYEGVLFIDTINWSYSFSPEHATALMERDEQLIGRPNLVFANHRYANFNEVFDDEERARWDEEVGRHVGTFPIAGTEYGFWNQQGEPSARWSRQFTDHVAGKVDDGFNGYLAFAWHWIDANSMTEDDRRTLTEHGAIVVEGFTARFADDGTPRP